MMRSDPMSIMRQQGFVLVGVVMLVLALTILGLSLFSLSSYESQFMTRSVAKQQALNFGLGGIERAKYVLAVTGDLDSVGVGLPLENVINATARQYQSPDTVSTGPIDWVSGEPVLISVTAKYDTIVRVEGQFEPRATESFYKRLFTTSGRDTVLSFVDYDDLTATPPENRIGTVFLYGGFWQGGVTAASDTGWTQIVGDWQPRGIRTTPVQTPATSPYIAAHASVALPANLSSNVITFPVFSGPVGYFRTTSSQNPNLDGRGYSYNAGSGVTIKVNGPTVWMLDDGMKVDNLVKVETTGATGAFLVIVANHNPQPLEELAGIWCFGGLVSQVPLILVSDGRILIEHYQAQLGLSSTVDNLSMFARNIQLTGPRSGQIPARKIALGHNPAVMNGLIDFLAQQGALPNTSAAIRTFALKRGTWRETR